VPNCYYLISSTPDDTSIDAVRCGEQHGGQTNVVGRGKKTRRFHILVYFNRLRDAEAALEPIKECLERQGHEVDPGYEVIEDLTELEGSAD
jgi:hypothetical protein